MKVEWTQGVNAEGRCGWWKGGCVQTHRVSLAAREVGQTKTEKEREREAETQVERDREEEREKGWLSGRRRMSYSMWLVHLSSLTEFSLNCSLMLRWIREAPFFPS